MRMHTHTHEIFPVVPYNFNKHMYMYLGLHKCMHGRFPCVHVCTLFMRACMAPTYRDINPLRISHRSHPHERNRYPDYMTAQRSVNIYLLTIYACCMHTHNRFPSTCHPYRILSGILYNISLRNVDGTFSRSPIVQRCGGPWTIHARMSTNTTPTNNHRARFRSDASVPHRMSVALQYADGCIYVCARGCKHA